MLEKDSENGNAMLILGKAYKLTNQLRKSENILHQAQNLYPSNVHIRRHLASVFMQRRNYENAVTAWQEIIAFEQSNLSDRFKCKYLRLNTPSLSSEKPDSVPERYRRRH